MIKFANFEEHSSKILFTQNLIRLRISLEGVETEKETLVSKVVYIVYRAYLVPTLLKHKFDKRREDKTEF